MNREIDKLGRLVIPKEMRKQLGLYNGARVHFECKGNQIIITNPNKENIDYKTRCEKTIELVNEMLEYAYIDGKYIMYDYSTNEILEIKKTLTGGDEE